LGAAGLIVGTAAAQSGYSSPQAQQGCDGQATTTQGYQGFRGNPSQQLQNRTDLSDEAAEMLLDTHQARQAIANGSYQSALRQIDEALGSARQACSLASMQGLRNMVPIYTEYTQASIIGPFQTARAQRQDAGGVQAAGVQGPVVQEVEAEFTRVAVDLPVAVQHLEAARTALLNNNPRAADSALSAAEGAVIMVRVERDLPLVKARQNLALAKGMIRLGDFQSARAPLNEAVNALGTYSGPHTAEAEQLQRQIAFSLSDNFGQNRQAAVNRIDQWWNELANYTTSESTQRQQRQVG
jgi:hypothetical protein